MPPATAMPPARAAGPRHLARRPAFRLPAALLILMAIQVRAWWLPTPDVTVYFSIARSVWTGHGLTSLGSRQLHNAPGYALLLSPLFLVSAHPFLLLSLLRCVMALAVLAAVYQWAKALLPRPGAAFVTAAVACNVSFWYYYRTPLSELPMMLWFFGAALALRRRRGAGSTRGGIAWGAAAAVLVAAAAITRQSALALGAGAALVAVGAAARGRTTWPRALALAAVLLLPSLLGLYALARYDHAMATLSRGHTLLDELPTLGSPLASLFLGLHLRLGEIGRLLIPGMWKCYAQPRQWLDPNLLLYAPLAALVVTGWWKLARRHDDPVLWAMPFYVGLYVVVWPFDADTRFFTPILPVLLAALWPWIEHLRRRRHVLAAGICLAHLVVAGAYWVVEVRHDGGEYRADWPALVALAEPLAGEPEPAAAAGIPDNASLWFQFLLDRPVSPVRPGQPIPAGVNLLIQPVSAAVPPGFRSLASSGPFRLCRRMPAICFYRGPPCVTMLAGRS